MRVATRIAAITIIVAITVTLKLNTINSEPLSIFIDLAHDLAHTLALSLSRSSSPSSSLLPSEEDSACNRWLWLTKGSDRPRQVQEGARAANCSKCF